MIKIVNFLDWLFQFLKTKNQLDAGDLAICKLFNINPQDY